MPRPAPLSLTLLLACGPAEPQVGETTGTTTTGGPPTTSSPSSADDASSFMPTSIDELPEGDIHLVFDPTDRGPSGDLIGWNIGRGSFYAPVGDPLHPEWRTPVMTAAVERLAEVRAPDRPPQVRFSGLQIDGALGNDGYHFFEWVDPMRAALPDDNMASFEFFALIDELAGTPRITLNFGSGTAQEAADYVTHLDGDDPGDPDVAARIFWGRDEPYAVTRFELGNEVYGFWNTGFTATGASYANPDAPGGGDPPWHSKPTSDPGDYAARALEYVAAVRDVEPDARFSVPLSQAAMDAWGGTAAALSGLAPLLAEPAVEAVVVHHYQADDGVTLGLADHDSPEFLLAGSELFRPGYLELQAQLAALPRPPGLAITEYHVAGAFAHGSFTRGDQAIVGLGIADAWILFAQLGVREAMQHMALGFTDVADPLFEPWYNPLRARGDELVAMPSLVVTGLLAEHLLPRRAALEVVRQEFLDLSVGTATISAPLVHAVAFVAEDGGRATVVALHRDLVNGRRLALDVPPGWEVESATQYAPPAFDLDARVTPIGRSSPPSEQYGPRIIVELAPHSVAALRLVLR